MNRHFFSQFLLQASVLACSLAPLAVFSQDLSSKIEQAYSRFENDETLAFGSASLTVLNSETGEAIFQKNQRQGLATASTLKVITAITALDLLGPDFRFQTKLSYTGTIDAEGVLHGDLIIAGTGDPTLGSHRYAETKEENILNKWIYAISNAGIRKIKGAIIGDDRLYGGINVPGGWIWSDMGNYYGAGFSSLNWRENAAGLTFEVGEVGEETHISNTTADISFLTIKNETTTGALGTGDQVYGYSAPYGNDVILKGSYGKDLKKTIEISIPNPAYDAAYQLYLALDEHGISVEELPYSAHQGNAEMSAAKTNLDTHESPKLTDIIYWFNQKSINLYGESLLQAIAQYGPQKGTPSQILRAYWQEKLKIPIGALKAIDGSGLSPQNRVTTEAMSQIMNYAINRPWYNEFHKSLPTYNQMKMKSGTIGGVLGYTGFHKNTNGKTYTFSLLVNNYQGNTGAMRKKMFELLDVLK